MEVLLKAMSKLIFVIAEFFASFFSPILINKLNTRQSRRYAEDPRDTAVFRISSTGYLPHVDFDNLSQVAILWILGFGNFLHVWLGLAFQEVITVKIMGGDEGYIRSGYISPSHLVIILSSQLHTCLTFLALCYPPPTFTST